MSGKFKDNAEWIFEALTYQLGYGLFYFTWRAAIGLLSPLIRAPIEKFLSSLIPEDRAWITNLFNHRAWRILRAICVGLSGIQLPSPESMAAVVADRKAKTGNTDQITKAP